MKKTIVISAINIFQAGPLTILNDCLSNLEDTLSEEYNIIAYVHNSLVIKTKKITLIDVPKSKKSYLHRLYYEYIWFFFQSKKVKPHLWLSLSDITPNVNAKIRAVYCHNASPFYKISLKEFYDNPLFFLFTLFYKYVYKINLNKNKFIIVQQDWLRKKFKNQFKAKSEIIVAKPNVIINGRSKVLIQKEKNKLIFFYPTYPRLFKNIECVCEAAKYLYDDGMDFELHLTISGNENRYARRIFSKFGKIPQIKYLGLLTREQVFEKFQECDTLVFSSKLESWGLPITEAKAYNKQILVSELPYAHETVGNYKMVSFFDPNDSKQLSNLMKLIIRKEIVFDENKSNPLIYPYSNNWTELFNILLNS